MATRSVKHDEQGVMVVEDAVDMERLLSVHEVADVLGTADGFVRRLVAARRIRFVRVGKHLRFPVSAVTEYIAVATVEPMPQPGRSA